VSIDLASRIGTGISIKLNLSILELGTICLGNLFGKFLPAKANILGGGGVSGVGCGCSSEMMAKIKVFIG